MHARAVLAGLLATVLLASSLVASPAAAGTVVLTVTGAVDDPPVAFTRSDLKALPRHELRTTTTVTDGVRVFEGFLMRDLLGRVGARGESVVALALNDYRMEIPIEDFERFDVIGALAMDGVPLTARDKGPIWIVYPRDDHRQLQDIRFDTRWVWQLRELDVR